MIALIRTLSPPGPGSRIIDVGCGTGRLVRLLSEAFPGAAVDGLDIDPAMVAAANAALPATPAGPIRYHVAADAGEWWRRQCQPAIALATCCFVLECMADPPATFAAVAAMLSAGGVFALIVSNPLFDRLMVPMNLLTGYRGDPNLRHTMPRSRVVALAAGNGLNLGHYERLGESVKWLPPAGFLRSYQLFLFTKGPIA